MQELRKKLIEKYPFTKIDDDTYWLEDFEKTGWFLIILQMCEECRKLLGEELMKYWEWLDFKEKFGMAVLYHNLSLDAPMNIVEEWIQKKPQLLEILRQTNLKTLDTCYFCGRPAVDHTVSGWYIGRCEKCLNDYKRKRKAKGKK